MCAREPFSLTLPTLLTLFLFDTAVHTWLRRAVPFSNSLHTILYDAVVRGSEVVRKQRKCDRDGQRGFPLPAVLVPSRSLPSSFSVS